MRKILFVTRPIAPPWDEASKNFAYQLAKTLGENSEFEIHLLTHGLVSDLPKKIIQEQIYSHSQNDFGLSQKIRLFWFIFLNAHNFNIIHFLFTPTKTNTFLMKIATIFSKAKTIQTIPTLRQDLFPIQDLHSFMFADMVTTYSQHAKDILKNLGIKHVEKIYPGVDLRNYRKKPRDPGLVLKYNLSANDFVINFSGEYTRLGAMDDVVESFIRVSKKIPTVKLSLSVRVKNENDAKKKKEIIEKLEAENILSKVIFHDDGNYNMADIYNLCDISIFPVRNMKGKFDVPLVVVEAMACEKPVIVSDIPILKEFANEANSVTIRQGDIDQLAWQIIDLYENKTTREQIGIQARQYVERNFSIIDAAQKYSEIYRTI